MITALTWAVCLMVGGLLYFLSLDCLHAEARVIAMPTAVLPAPASAPGTPPKPAAAASSAAPILANPLNLAPSGSKPGRISIFDWARTAVAGLTSYGTLSAVTGLWIWFEGHPEFLGKHGDAVISAVNAIVAATVAVSHLMHAYAGDNTPRPAAPAPRVP